jgi:hypothetical protein
MIDWPPARREDAGAGGGKEASSLLKKELLAFLPPAFTRADRRAGDFFRCNGLTRMRMLLYS